VALSMGIGLYLAVYFLKQNWQGKEVRATRNMPPAAPVVKPPPLHGKMAETDEMLVEGGVRSPDDTEAIREATFAAKRGESLEGQGKYAEAIEQYRTAIHAWPNLTAAWVQLGRAYLHTRDYARARHALKRASEDDENAADVLNDLGVAFYLLTRLDKAYEQFVLAARADPAYPPPHFNIALCCLAAGNHGEAATALQQFRRLRPDDPRGMREAAYLAAAQGNYEEAIKLLEQAIERVPDWAPPYFDAAAASALAGDAASVFRYLQEAERLTSPLAAYRSYVEPAYREIRTSEAGKRFEEDLVRRAKESRPVTSVDRALPGFREPLASFALSLSSNSASITSF
jgi:tetratricopeptide (TPR) repeat protein